MTNIFPKLLITGVVLFCFFRPSELPQRYHTVFSLEVVLNDNGELGEKKTSHHTHYCLTPSALIIAEELYFTEMGITLGARNRGDSKQADTHSSAAYKLFNA